MPLVSFFVNIIFFILDLPPYFTCQNAEQTSSSSSSSLYDSYSSSAQPAYDEVSSCFHFMFAFVVVVVVVIVIVVVVVVVRC